MDRNSPHVFSDRGFLVRIFVLLNIAFAVIIILSGTFNRTGASTADIFMVVLFAVLFGLQAVALWSNVTRPSIFVAVIAVPIVALIMRPEVTFMEMLYPRQFLLVNWIILDIVTLIGIAMPILYRKRLAAIVVAVFLVMLTTPVSLPVARLLNIEAGELGAKEMVLAGAASILSIVLIALQMEKGRNWQGVWDCFVSIICGFPLLAWNKVRVALSVPKAEEDTPFEIMQIERIGTDKFRAFIKHEYQPPIPVWAMVDSEEQRVYTSLCDDRYPTKKALATFVERVEKQVGYGQPKKMNIVDTKRR
jgi:hypothetical protein